MFFKPDGGSSSPSYTHFESFIQDVMVNRKVWEDAEILEVHSIVNAVDRHIFVFMLAKWRETLLRKAALGAVGPCKSTVSCLK